MRKLVIGATGTVGFYTVRKLKELDQKILVATRNISSGRERLKRFGDMDYVNFDLKDDKTYEEALENVESVILIKPNNISEIKYIKKFIDKAVETSVRHIVFLSTIDSEKNKLNFASKVEEYLKTKEVIYTIVRSNIFMENLVYPHAKEIRALGKILIPAGNSKISLISAEDVGEVCAISALNPFIHTNKTYILTGGEAISYNEIAKVLSESLDKKIVYTNPSFSLYKNQLKNNGYSKNYINFFILMYTVARVGALKNISGDVEKLLYRKPVTFQEFTHKYRINWITSKGFLLNREI